MHTFHRITARSLLRQLAVTGLTGLFIVYVLWQSRIFLTGPVITMTTAPPATTSAAYVDIAGTAEHIVWITINNRPIVTTPEGAFAERVILETGYTILTLEAADRFGRTTRVEYGITPVDVATTTSVISSE